MSSVAKDMTSPGFPTSVGPRIKVARENAGLSQAELARRLGVELASVVAWEGGAKQPRANRLMMLCGVLDVSLKWLLEGREDAHMSQQTDSLPVIRAELGHLRTVLDEANRLVGQLSSQIQTLEDRLDHPGNPS